MKLDNVGRAIVRAAAFRAMRRAPLWIVCALARVRLDGRAFVVKQGSGLAYGHGVDRRTVAAKGRAIARWAAWRETYGAFTVEKPISEAMAGFPRQAEHSRTVQTGSVKVTV
jgi:hypothetical protein